MQANFARLEPCHGRFRFCHPWQQYLKIGNLSRQCAYRIDALNGFLNSSTKVLIGLSFLFCSMKHLLFGENNYWMPWNFNHFDKNLWNLVPKSSIFLNVSFNHDFYSLMLIYMSHQWRIKLLILNNHRWFGWDAMSLSQFNKWSWVWIQTLTALNFSW